MSHYLYTISGSIVTAALALFLSTAWAVNINLANEAQLDAVKGIGAKTAQKIIAERERAGAFKSYDDVLLRIDRLGQKTLKKWHDAGLTVNNVPWSIGDKAVHRSGDKPSNPQDKPQAPSVGQASRPSNTIKSSEAANQTSHESEPASSKKVYRWLKVEP